MRIMELITKAIEAEVMWQDIYLRVGKKPSIRNPHGILELDDAPIKSDDIYQLLSKQGFFPSDWKDQIETGAGKVDATIPLYTSNGNDEPRRHYMRATLYRAREWNDELGSSTSAMRMVIRNHPPLHSSFSKLGLPDALFTALTGRGLCLFAGPIGQGKTTTMSTYIARYNLEREGHIVSIERPIEHFHQEHKCLISQRQVPEDAPTFGAGVEDALRQRTDLLAVGEFIEPETMHAAFIGAEAGLNVVGTIHSVSAVKAIERVLGLLSGPEEDRRARIASALRTVVYQRLLPHANQREYVMAYEILTKTPQIEAKIRAGDLKGVEADMMAAAAKHNSVMMTLDQCLLQLFRDKKISSATALQNANDRSGIEREMNAAGRKAA